MILAIVGPTGVGKTKLSIELANIFNGEIINADSMQIYEGLDIGTAKVTKEEMQGVKHHLLSIKKVEDDYSVYDYQIDARKKIEDIKSRGKVPIFVGGSGYYLKAALYDYKFLKEEKSTINYDNLTQEELIKKIDSYNLDIIYDKNNKKRLIRLLKRLDNNSYVNDDRKLLYDDVIFIGLTCDRKILYQKINERFDNMLEPLLEEVKYYWSHNIKTKALMTGIGYKEFYPYFDGIISLDEVVENIKKNSRHYAKRQYTWFKNQMDIKWFNVDYDDFSKTVEEIVKYIKK